MISETYNIDCIEYCKTLKKNSVNIILTDPPYKYLKNQKLETDFNEIELFTEWKRIIKKGGFIVLFGRGTSFYRWNYMLSELGFEFKEEIIWNKRRNSIPGLPLMRRHETISIMTFGKNTINRVYIDYFEKKQFDLISLQNDVKRILSGINSKEIKAIEKFINDGIIDYEEQDTVHFFKHGFKAKSRSANTLNIINRGLCESSIIELNRDHYHTIHPTQKPVRLLERLLMLVKKSDNDLVLDCFLGSQSTRIASYNLGLNFIGCELDKEYFEQGNKRFEQYKAQGKLF